MARLKELYVKDLRNKLKEKFKLENIFEVPKIEKIVVNMGVGEAAVDSKKINSAIDDLTQITGQKPQTTQAKKFGTFVCDRKPTHRKISRRSVALFCPFPRAKRRNNIYSTRSTRLATRTFRSASP